jgi:GNAT superfamily N-acetyltransferase
MRENVAPMARERNREKLRLLDTIVQRGSCDTCLEEPCWGQFLMSQAKPFVRRATAADLACLPAIERSAAQAFRGAGVSLDPDGPVSSADAWRPAWRAGTVWVAGNEAGRVVGFLAARRINRVLHIDEMDVAFDYQRRGFGRALLDAAIDWSRQAGLKEITLTTFRDLAFNRHFYASAGFEEIAPQQMTERIASLMSREAEYGLDPKQRCAMVLRLRDK